MKIKFAQEKIRKREVEIHAFVFHDKLNQLKADINMKWLFGYELTNITDIKKFIDQISSKYQLKPEHQSQLEEYKESSEDFKMTLQYLSSRLNQSGKTHIILIEEVELKNIISPKHIEDKHLELDLAYISEYENIHFIFCLRPAKEGLNNFTISFPSLQSNQYFVCLGTIYRNTEAIQRIIKNIQSQISAKSEGYSSVEDIPINERLPPPLIPSGYNSSVIWVPVIPSVEDEALGKIHELLLFGDFDELQGKEYPSIVILYTNDVSKTMARKLIQKNATWYGPLEDVNYNGSEADVVVFISDGYLNVQALARARRLLIIITFEKKWYHSTYASLKLKKAIALDMVEILRLGDCPYDMIKCEECQSKFDEKSFYYHFLEECQVKCQNYGKGCEWKGLIRLKENHIIDDCLYNTYSCLICNEDVLKRDIYQHLINHLFILFFKAILLVTAYVLILTIIYIRNKLATPLPLQA